MFWNTSNIWIYSKIHYSISSPKKPQNKPKIVIPTEPPVEFEFCHDPPTLNALELDIVKLTAQFVARNGRSFLTQLMQKEAKNYQFDFLRPQHTLFQECFTNIMILVLIQL